MRDIISIRISCTGAECRTQRTFRARNAFAAQIRAESAGWLRGAVGWCCPSCAAAPTEVSP